jgi:hypothetical protein
MCKPSCCPGKSGEGTGIMAIAVLAAGAIVVAEIGPIVARILHVVVEVLTIVTLTAASALTCIVLTWLGVRIVRWRARQQLAHQTATPKSVSATAPDDIRAGTTAGCLACGDSGTVLRAINSSRYQTQPCPICEPIAKAR